MFSVYCRYLGKVFEPLILSKIECLFVFCNVVDGPCYSICLLCHIFIGPCLFVCLLCHIANGPWFMCLMLCHIVGRSCYFACYTIYILVIGSLLILYIHHFVSIKFFITKAIHIVCVCYHCCVTIIMEFIEWYFEFSMPSCNRGHHT